MLRVVRLAVACVGQITLPQHASASPSSHGMRHPAHLGIVYASQFALTSHAPINEGADHYGESATPEQRREAYAENDGARHNRKQRSGIGPDAHFRHVALKHAMPPASVARSNAAGSTRKGEKRLRAWRHRRSGRALEEEDCPQDRSNTHHEKSGRIAALRKPA